MDSYPLLLMDGDFEFYCLQLPVGIPKILMLFPVGMRVHCNFPMGMKFQGFFSLGTNSRPIFSVGKGFHHL